MRHQRPIAWGTAVAGAILLALALRVPFDAELTRLRPTASAAAAVQAEVEALFGGSATSAAALVEAPTLEAALQASERIAAQLDQYRTAHMITSVRTITGLLPSERTQRERLARFNALPRRRIAQDLRAALPRYGFVAGAFDPFFQEFERARDAIVRRGDPALQPFEELVERHVRSGERSSIVATYIDVPGATTIDAVAVRLQHDLPGVDFVVAARSLLEAELSRLLRRELIGFCLLSLMANLVLIWWNFRSVGVSLAILAPQGVVIVALLAFLAVTGSGIGPITLVVVPLILGIGVDYCVYVAERFRHGETPEAAVRNGGRALVVSGLTTMAGFGFLGLSRYPALAHMGLFTAASLLLCVVGAVTVLPALLGLWGGAEE
jgi:predicted RND superfamily exporter protein